MLSYLLRQLTNSFGIFFRTIRAFFTRKLTGAWSRLRRITNFSRQATKVATASFQGAAAAVKRPTKREDYIETRRLFISKSFLILLAVGGVLLALLGYFVVWPFLLSHFFTARFYHEDERVEQWSGRVVVYYDEARTLPMYQGTLEEGVLQGKGMEYDEAGLLVYEGNFVDGVRSGRGALYETGVLVYEGQFDGGRANGMGTAYADGVKCYEGAFAEGLYEGEGTAYYADGTPRYKGAFSAGEYEGAGTAYAPDGSRIYVGSFVGGRYEGEGTEYGADGAVCYKGTFAEGRYNGSGTIYRPNGDQIRAEFTDGVTNGAIQWYRDGKLWYDGGADNLTPDGFGTLYAASGKSIYAGQLDRGTLDGAWLLSLTAEELREAFGEAVLSEKDRGNGFCIVNESLGLTALCSYQQEGQEAQAYRLWFTPEAGTANEALLPWPDRAAAEAWAMEGPGPEPSEERLRGGASEPDGAVDGNWYQSRYRYGDYTCILLCKREEEAPVRLCWGRDMTLPGGGAVDFPVSQAQQRLEELLDALDGTGDSASGGGAELGDVERMLGLMLTVEDGQTLVDALTDYQILGHMEAALTASQPFLEQNLAEEQTKLAKGQGSQEAVDSARAELDRLDRRLAQYKTAREQARLTIQDLSKLEPDDYDLQAVLLAFDPVELNIDALCSESLAYALAVAAGRYEVDGQALEQELKSAVLELSMSYETIRSARVEVEQAAALVEAQTQTYARGTGDRAELYAALCAQNEAAAALCQAVGTFTHQANRLNILSGGWVSEQYGWMEDSFATLFQSEVLRGEEAAQKAREERTQREEEAAQVIRGEQEANTPASTIAPEER